MKHILLILSLIFITSCAIEHRHTGDVQVQIDIDELTELLTPVCLRELGLEQYEVEELTDNEFFDLEDCIDKKIADLLAEKEIEDKINEKVNEELQEDK